MPLSYLKDHYGDLASVVGLLVTFVGFFVTIWNVRKTKQAAEEARQAAREAVSRIGSQILANEIGSALELVRQTDAACRERNWSGASYQCDEARFRLAQLLNNLELNAAERKLHRVAYEDLGETLTEVHKLQKSTKPQDSSVQLGKRLHEMIKILGQIKGRLQSKVLEI